MIQGMKRFHARRAVVDALKELGLYVEQKDNPMVVPICRYVVVGAFILCWIHLYVSVVNQGILSNR
jgi:valyl-tRNA synthetase